MQEQIRSWSWTVFWLTWVVVVVAVAVAVVVVVVVVSGLLGSAQVCALLQKMAITKTIRLVSQGVTF